MIDFHYEEKEDKKFRDYIAQIDNVENWRVYPKAKSIDGDWRDLAIIIYKENDKYKIHIGNHNSQITVFEKTYEIPEQEAIILEMIYEEVEKKENRSKLVDEYIREK